MVDVQVNYLGREATLHLPTQVNEIKPALLNEWTNHISLAKDYALVALVFKERPITLVSSVKQNKNTNVSGVAIMIKANTNDEVINDIKLGDALVIAASDIAIGHHVVVPGNHLTPGFIIGLLNENDDLNKKFMEIMIPTYFVDFKIVPVCNIHGSIGSNATNENYYLEVKQ